MLSAVEDYRVKYRLTKDFLFSLEAKHFVVESALFPISKAGDKSQL